MPSSDIDMDEAAAHQTQPPPKLLTEDELDEEYPNRPRNHSTTLPFHDLYLTLFNPLNDAKKRRVGPATTRRHPPKQSPYDLRRSIIDDFVHRWRTEVGNDIHPAFRLIVPEKDKDRPMYGLKEMTIAKLMLKVLQIDKASEDGYNLLHWKLPGVKSTSSVAGDFAGRVYEAIGSRARRKDSEPGNLTIVEVNERLDRLARFSKEQDQLPIFRDFFNNMNRDEMMWLIRIILRQMKVGATEKTLFHAWHPDAETLFNVSSDLKRVCWELVNPDERLDGDEKAINIMQCFQPQLAQFQGKSIEKMVDKMQCTEEDPHFWIEEKLDGERMQLHMNKDESEPGGFLFRYLSRKAKDYTELYGKNFYQGALTRHLSDAFKDGVRNIILDGEMISWDMTTDHIVGFGHLKTHAKAHKEDPDSDHARPLFRVFDCLYLNDQDITKYTLRDRRKALDEVVMNVHRRFEIHEYIEATSAAEVEPMLRDVVAKSSEGLVLKNPRSIYRLNSRNDDWMKVKPDYMTEFGESLDCVVIGGYYGSGHRGGNLSSFLCGLRLPPYLLKGDVNPEKTYSFFKVGGGFTAQDYAEIRHLTDGKWTDWDPMRPPTDWIELGGEGLQYERPDVWIKPSDSVVLQVKAASVIMGERRYKTNFTLRFPRFTALRKDKDWKQALSIDEFQALKSRVEHEKEEKEFKVDEARKKRAKRSRKKELTVIGANDQVKTPYAGPETALFNGMSFYIITGAAKPLNKSKAELEQLVKANGGNIVATHTNSDTICIGEGNPIRIASIKKAGTRNIIKPYWLLECIKQAEADVGRPNILLPFEPRHVLFNKAEDEESFEHNIDEYGDSFARDVDIEELEDLIAHMPKFENDDYDADDIMDELFDDDVLEGPGCMFRNLRICIAGEDPRLEAAKRIVLFAGAQLAESVNDEGLTHVVVNDRDRMKELGKRIAMHRRPARIVTSEWVTSSLREGTRLDEESELCYTAVIKVYTDIGRVHRAVILKDHRICRFFTFAVYASLWRSILRMNNSQFIIHAKKHNYEK